MGRKGPQGQGGASCGQSQCHSVLSLDQAGWGLLEHEMRGRALWGQTLPNAEEGSGMALGGHIRTRSSSAR